MLVGDLPDLEIFLINNVECYSCSISLSKNNFLYNKILCNHQYTNDIKNIFNEEFYSLKNKIVALYYNHIKLKDQDNIYIHLLHEHSYNYFHWLYEVIPRIILINQLIIKSKKLKNKTFIILIDDNLPYQLHEILYMIIDFKYEIKILERNKSATVNTLLYCSNLWTSLDNTKFKSNIKKEFFIDSYAVALIRRTFKKFMTHLPATRKIYLDRKSSQARSLTNNNEVKKLLIKNEFEIIDVSKLTFIEQIILFSESKIIMAVSGAYFSNIIFMQKDTKAIIFSPKTIGTNYYIFQPMADIAKIKLIHLLTNNKMDDMHESSDIDLLKIKNLLKE